MAFTLPELLVCLTIFSLLSVMCYSEFSQLTTRQKQESTLSTIFHALQYARQEAIYQQQALHVGSLATRCMNTWVNAFGIYTKNLAQENQWLRTHQLDLSSTLQSNQPCGFTFLPDGHCSTPGTLTLVGANGRASQIVINDSGRIRIKLAE